MWLRLAIAAFVLSALTSCSGWQNALDPASGDAEHISWLFWLFVGVLGAIWALVMVVLGLALMMRSRRIDDPLTSHPERDQRTAWVIAVLSGATLVTVLILTGISFVGQRRLFGPREEAVTIRVTGHQWWWDVRYEDDDPARTFTTANEVHLPLGKPVNIKLNSSDVIHSFWVPNLMGKLDLIPGRENQLRLTPDRAGIYRGQCAEYCGLQHAHMGFMVVVEPQEAFERWRNGQIAPAVQPEDDERKRGQAAFLSQPCVMCHSVRGTTAGGRVAPDLTHIGGRLTLAAGTLPVSRGNLAAWIVDPHGIKPGVNMPMIKLPPDDLNAISAYLEGLK